MLLQGTTYHDTNIIRRGQGDVPGRGGGKSGVRKANDLFGTMLETSEKISKKDGKKDLGQGKTARNQLATDRLIEEVSQMEKPLNREELLQFLSEHREEILKKIKNGDTGVKIPIGSMYLTEEEWEKLLDSFDKAQEKIQENVREESGEELPERRPDTTVNGNKVLAPEDTGHDLKPLEELAAEVDSKGASKEETEKEAQKTEADGSLKAWQTERDEQLRNAGVKRTESFADYLPGMQVITKTGDCTVSSGTWCRTDFPFWEYFKEGVSADALNNWRPEGPQPDMLDPGIQRNLQEIGYGKMSILIPEKLQAKMDADPAYADEIYRKVADWKKKYDDWDNATAASLGMNVAAHQFSKSYCVQLDEDGNVANFTVVGGGLDITQSEKTVEDNWLKRRNAAILFHKMHLAKMGYTGITGTAGIVAEEGEDSPLALLRAALMAGTLLMDEEEIRKKDGAAGGL